MNKIKKLSLIVLFVTTSLGLQAQYYKQSAGVRTGFSSAVTYKHFYNESQSIEAMLGGRNQGLQITGLYTFHQPLNIVITDMVYFYYGVGAHVGFENYTTKDKLIDPNDINNNQHSFLVMGIDTTVGVEYRMLAIPLTFGLDIKPYIQLVDMRYGDTKFWDVGASVKYVF